MQPTRGTHRRAVLAALAATAGGCLSRVGFEPTSAWRDPPVVADRPDAIYIPAIIEGMRPLGMVEVGPLTVMLSYSYPHRFYRVTGDARSVVPVDAADSIHLMLSVNATATGVPVVVPSGVTVAIERGGRLVTEEVVYPMIAQQMGVHYGGNIALEGAGSYAIEFTLGGTQLETDGLLGTTAVSDRVTFTFDPAALGEISIAYPTDAGARGAMPAGPMGQRQQLPEPLAAPAGWARLGTAPMGDLRLVGFTDAEERLRVVAMTRYNRYPMPMLSLQAGDVALTPVIDRRLGYHYRSATAGDAAAVPLRATLPPQIARHDGYETAFMQLPAVSWGATGGG